MLSVGIGLAAYALFGIAMALMKYGASSLARPRRIVSDPETRRRFGVWLVGAVLNLAYALLITYALGLGRASLLGALNGFGLVVLAMLSHVLLDERIGARELGGIAWIILGTSAFGAVAGAEAVSEPERTPEELMIPFCVAGLVSSTLVVAASWLGTRRRLAQALAVAAGVTGGLTLLGQKALMGRIHGGLELGAVPGEPLFLWLLAVSNLSFALVQVAYQHGPAVVVVPLFTAAVILTPVLGGVVVYGEPWSLGMGLALACVLAGAWLLTGGAPPRAATGAVDHPPAV